MIYKNILITALVCAFGTTLPMLVRYQSHKENFSDKYDTYKTQELLQFVEKSPIRAQEEIFKHLNVESEKDYNTAFVVALHQRSKDIPNLGMVFNLTPETRDVLNQANEYFDTTGKRKITLTIPQYNTLAAVPFIIRKNYHNDTRFFKAVVLPDFYTKVLRVGLTTGVGVVGGAVVGAACGAGVQYGVNMQQGHAQNLEQKITIFNKEYPQQFENTFTETYKNVVLNNANPAEEFVKEFKYEQDARDGIGYKGAVEDKMGGKIFHGGADLVNAQRDYQTDMQKNPAYCKQQQLIDRTVDAEAGGQSIINEEIGTFGIGTFGGFIKGVFQNSFQKHHETAVEIGIQTATNTALSMALSAIHSIGAPIINSNISWDNIKESTKIGAFFGGLGSFGYSIWYVNEPIEKKRISEMDQPL